MIWPKFHPNQIIVSKYWKNISLVLCYLCCNGCKHDTLFNLICLTFFSLTFFIIQQSNKSSPDSWHLPTNFRLPMWHHWAWSWTENAHSTLLYCASNIQIQQMWITSSIVYSTIIRKWWSLSTCYLLKYNTLNCKS